MENVTVRLDERGFGGFYITADGEQIGEMEVGIKGNDMTVYHTEVAPEAEGKGVAKNLIAAMVDYAQNHQLKVVPLCPYVLAQFKRHPDAYAHVWHKQ